MNDVSNNPTIIGSAFAGGFLAPQIRVDGQIFNVIVAPKAEGLIELPWSKSLKRVDGAQSYFDGLANTRAMAAAGSELAQRALDLRIGGFDDWYIPSRDELEILYRAFKPTEEENWVYRNGENPSAVPPTYPYTEDFPKQTAVEAFRAGGAEAFDRAWHWSSTQCADDAGYAWIQYFGDGFQGYARKGGDCRARAVRRVAIS